MTTSKSGATVVMRNASTGRLTVGGTDERCLVNKHSVKVKSAGVKPKHFSSDQIKVLTKRMKVA